MHFWKFQRGRTRERYLTFIVDREDGHSEGFGGHPNGTDRLEVGMSLTDRLGLL